MPELDTIPQAYVAVTDKLFVVSQLDIFGSFCKFLLNIASSSQSSGFDSSFAGLELHKKRMHSP